MHLSVTLSFPFGTAFYISIVLITSSYPYISSNLDTFCVQNITHDLHSSFKHHWGSLHKDKSARQHPCHTKTSPNPAILAKILSLPIQRYSLYITHIYGISNMSSCSFNQLSRLNWLTHYVPLLWHLIHYIFPQRVTQFVSCSSSSQLGSILFFCSTGHIHFIALVDTLV